MACNNPKEELINCFTMQLSELEVLTAMYPNPGEIILSDSKILEEVNSFVNGQSDYVPGHLDFSLNFIVDNVKLELCINLPTFYPNVEPDTYVRSNQLNRNEQTNLNTALSEFVKTIPVDEPNLYSLVTWIQDNVHNYIGAIKNDHDIKTIEEKEKYFARYWIHSHHIYNKKKIDEVLNTAKVLGLCGFCLPGKPGIICIEGNESDCKEFWQVIKSLNWKKIILKKTELYELKRMLENKKFEKFTEVHFQKNYHPGNKHMDMKEFSKYMHQHGLSDTFYEIFGLDSVTNNS